MQLSDLSLQQAVTPASSAWDVPRDWRTGITRLTSPRAALRELRLADAPSLLSMLVDDDVTRFMSPPPGTIVGFERFIEWARDEQAAGRHIGFAITPAGQTDTAIGVIQLRQLTPDFENAEWGFAIGSPYWGNGMFIDAAHLAMMFAFETLGVHRLEARAAVLNGRGNGALAKLGAVRECVLRNSFLRNGKYLDQALWSIVREDWQRSKAVWGSSFH
jgi:ribosomal-protein-alanine N-acetyltransferase